MAKPPTIIKELYNGKIKIGFWEEQHRYATIETDKDGNFLSVKENWLVSVTGATGMIDKSRVLMYWASNLTKEYLYGNIELLKKSTKDVEIKGIVDNAVVQHRLVKEEAAAIGTQVHEWCEEYINAKPKDRKTLALPEEERALNGVTAFLSWVNTHKVKFIDTEKLVYSKKHDYVGLLDLKAIVDGKLTLVDFKTSKGVYPEYYIQVSSYLKADEEECGDKYDGAMILHFDKETGDFGTYEVPDVNTHFKAFINCLGMKRWAKLNSKRID